MIYLKNQGKNVGFLLGAGPQALFRGILPRSPLSGKVFPGLLLFFGATAPDPVLGALPPMPLVPFFFSRKKKKVPKKKFAGCMNFAKNSTFFPKMLKLGAPLLKQVSIS